MDIILIVGENASGKSTLEKELVTRWPKKYKKAVSVTTRPQRPGEVDGVDYRFVSKDEFKQIDLLESVEFGGAFYGLPASELSNEKTTVVVVEPYGARQILDYAEERDDIRVYLIYLDIPESVRCELLLSAGVPEDEVERRLGRGNIDLTFKELDLRPDLVVKKLRAALPVQVHEYVELSKRVF